MRTEFTEFYLMTAWQKGIRIQFKGKKYRVGRMSYGDWFLEPGKPQGETKPFNKGTIWLEIIDGKKDTYKINRILTGLAK